MDLYSVAKAENWVVTDDYQVLKKLDSTKFIVVEANPLTNSDKFVVSQPMLIDLNYWLENNGCYTAKLESIILAFYESIEQFNEANEGNVDFRNQLLAEMIYESCSELHPSYGKMDENAVIGYLSFIMKMEERILIHQSPNILP